MNEGRTVFSQILDTIHREQFERCVARYTMPRESRSFSTRDQLLSMAFAQITFRESPRDIEACLRGSQHLRAMGIRGRVTRTNLAYESENWDWRVYEALAQILIRKAQRLYTADKTDLDLDEMVYAIDSSTIDLCLSLFPWAHFRQTKSAIKVHTEMQIQGSIPVFIRISTGKVHYIHYLDQVVFQPGSIYVVDRAYVDFDRLFRIHQALAFFVTRAKTNLRFHVLESNPVDKTTGLKCDQIIALNTSKSKTAFPQRLKRIRFVDPESGKSLTVLTSHFSLPAFMISKLYKSRWQIELFFKWIKKKLRIKAFYGNSENAVKTQVWIAICTYLMIACLKKVHQIPESLNRIMQILNINAFQKVALDQLLTDFETNLKTFDIHNRLKFNDLLTGQ